MRERTLIHVAGPAGAGKTTLIEAMLAGIDRLMLAARCRRDDSLRRPRESHAKTHPELKRYRAAGAVGAASFSFPHTDVGSEGFFLTDLMDEYSEGVVLEGDNPVAAVEQLAADIVRLRKDDELFDDILGFRGSRIPVTVVITKLTDERDPGRRKALTRIRRAVHPTG